MLQKSLESPVGPQQGLPSFTQILIPSELWPSAFCSVKVETSEFTASLVSPYGAHCACVVANAFGSGCAYHMQKTQCWAESSWLIKAGAEQFVLQRRKLSTIQHRGHTQLFSLGMTINLWQIPLLLAAHSGLTRKKKQLHQQRNVPPRFTGFPVVSEHGNYISFRAVCTLLSRWKHEGFGMHV